MKKKLDLDLEVASRSGTPYKLVRKVTTEFVSSLADALATDGKVQIPGLGTFRVVTRRGKQGSNLTKSPAESAQHVVVFSKSDPLRDRLKQRLGGSQEDTMEKYAVDEDVDQEDLEKKANQGCPNCGREPERHGKTLICPKCGTEPFENK